MARADPYPSFLIENLLKQEAASAGRVFISTGAIARRLRMTNKMVGQRVARLASRGVDGVRIVHWVGAQRSPRGSVWLVEATA